MTVAQRAEKANSMEFGVHLPLLASRGQVFSLSRLLDYAQTAEQLGFTRLCANDHLTFSRPWLDSLTALAAVLTKTPHMTLMTTVALPVVRGPIPLAKSLAALDALSGGCLVAGVGPGSLPQDYALVGVLPSDMVDNSRNLYNSPLADFSSVGTPDRPVSARDEAHSGLFCWRFHQLPRDMTCSPHQEQNGSMIAYVQTNAEQRSRISCSSLPPSYDKSLAGGVSIP